MSNGFDVIELMWHRFLARLLDKYKNGYSVFLWININNEVLLY